MTEVTDAEFLRAFQKIFDLGFPPSTADCLHAYWLEQREAKRPCPSDGRRRGRRRLKGRFKWRKQP